MRKHYYIFFILLVILANHISLFLFISANNPSNFLRLTPDKSDIDVRSSTEESFKEFLVINSTGAYTIDLSNTQTLPPHWFIHIPIITDFQCPIVLLDVWTEPIDVIEEYKINSQDFSGDNYVLEIIFSEALDREIYKLFWRISILLTYGSESSIPRYLEVPTKENLPDNVLIWLNSTEFIQVNSFEIQSKAKELSDGESNLIDVVDNVISYTSNSIEYDLDPNNPSQDALSTLRRKSAVCIGKANLATALLRACDIPARVSMIYPTHFITECYLHPFGWVRVEPGLSEFIYKPLKLPDNILEAFLLYISTFNVYPEDESSHNNIEGFSPIKDGVPAYWAPIDNSIDLTIDLTEDWEIEFNEISSSIEAISSVLNVSKRIWNIIVSYNIDQTYSRMREIFPKSYELLKNALFEISRGNLNEYISYMTQVLAKYESNDDGYEYMQSVPIINGVSIEFLGLIIFIEITLFIALIKKRKLNHKLD